MRQASLKPNKRASFRGAVAKCRGSQRELFTEVKSQSDVSVRHNGGGSLDPVMVRLIGFGCVGSAVYRAINIDKSIPGVSVSKILVLRKNVARVVEVPDGCVAVGASMFTTDVEEFFSGAEEDVIIDASNDDRPQTILRALGYGLPVISANKKLLATHGDAFVQAALEEQTHFQQEAAALAKVGVFRELNTLRLFGIRRLAAISNGTANFVLSRRTKEGIDYDAALQEAGDLGYAEADPTLDVDGFDSHFKNKLLAATAFGLPSLLNGSVDDTVYRDGIRGIDSETFRFADHYGLVVKLVSSATVIENNRIALKTIPTLVAADSFLGTINGVNNAVVVEDELGPPTELAGPGAGGDATAAAIVADLAQIRRARVQGNPPEAFQNLLKSTGLRLARREEVPMRPVFQSASPQHDPGVMKKKFEVLERAGLSVEQFHNGSEIDSAGCTPDVLACEETNLGTALEAARSLERLPCVRGPVKLLDVDTTRPLRLTRSTFHQN